MDTPEIERGGGLVRSLSLTHAVLYGLGVTIGAGIYVLIGVAAGRSGMHAPLAFLFSAAALAPVAAVFADLGTRMPVSASEAAYVEAAFGRRLFTTAVGLLVIATAIVSAATISAGSASYIGAMVDLPAPAIIAAVVLSMGAVASMATRQAVAIAGLMTVVEVSGLGLIIAAGSANGVEALSRLPELMPGPGDGAEWTGLASSSLVAVFAFIGFEHLVNVAEEIRAPSRNLPRALFLTLAITAVLYALVAWIAVVAVAPDELAASPAPLALVFGRLTGMDPAAMGGIAIVATLNGVVVHMIMISRVIYGMSRQRNLPAALSRVNPVTRTPLIATAIAVGTILALALLVPLAGLADIASRGTLVIFAVVSLALIAIKRKGGPVAEGAFVCPTWLAATGLLSSTFLLAAELL
jgi:amino acid transporter